MLVDPVDFTFTEAMISEANSKKKTAKRKIGRNAFHPSLKNKGSFALLAWNAWLLLAPFLRNELQKRCPEIDLGESEKNPIFELTHIDKIFKLRILQGWAAKKLGLSKENLFKQDDPIKVYTEIVCKFLSKDA